MNKIEEWFEQGLTPDDLYSLYEEFRNKFYEIEDSKKKPLSKILEKLQSQLPIGSYWNIIKKSDEWVDECGSFLFSNSGVTQLKIKIKSVKLIGEENDIPSIKITYDFFQIWKDSNNEGNCVDLRYEEGWTWICKEEDLKPIGFESITEEEYIEFGNRVKSIIELV